MYEAEIKWDSSDAVVGRVKGAARARDVAVAAAAAVN